MNNLITTVRRFALAGVAGGAILLMGDDVSIDRTASSFISHAFARIGRPLTPMSYAGVARRTTRRTVAAGAAVGAATYYHYRPGCVQVVDVYGRMYWRC